MKISTLLLTFFFVATSLLCGSANSANPSAQSQPNILFLFVDDLGWNDIGYHNPEIRSPNLDALSKESVLLTHHYVQPQCTPSRVALMTGRYPSRFGSHCCQASNDHAFPFETVTLASLLQEAGYFTALTGKWHLGSRPEQGPNKHGFESSYGSLAGAVGAYDHRYRLNTPYAKTWHRDCKFLESEEGHATDLVTAEAIRVLKMKHEKPFFLYVPFHSVHTPIITAEKWVELNKHIEHRDRQLYAAAVSFFDDCVGKILKALDESGHRENTLIVFVSDNGAQVNHRGNAYPGGDPKLTNFSSNAPLRGQKCTAYEGGMRVPAMVNWKGKLKPRKVSTPIHLIDWLPTFAALALDETPEQIAKLAKKNKWDGIDIWPALLGEMKQRETPIYTVWSNRRWEAVNHDGWKIVRSGSGKKSTNNKEWELYNLNNDPNEKTNLAEKNPKKLAELSEVYKSEKKKDAF